MKNNNMKKLSVIIINYNTPVMTKKVYKTFLNMEKNLDFEIILIDNGSKYGIDKIFFKKLGANIIINNSNLGFAKAVNQGIKKSHSKFILLLNSDVLIDNNAISRALKYMEKDKKIGILGIKLVYPNRKIQPSFGNFPDFWNDFMRFSMLSKIIPGGTLIYKNFFTKSIFKNSHETDWVSGGCMLIRSEVLDQIGFFDENYFFGIEDFDFCFRAKKMGWKIIYYPFSEAIHYHGFSSGGRRSTFSLNLERHGMNYFFKKHFSEKIISRLLIRFMYIFKIIILNFIFKIKNIFNFYENYFG